MEQNENIPKWARDDYKGFETFKEDLAKASKTEKEIATLLEEILKAEVVEFNNDYRYDVKLIDKDGKEITVEIKEDFTCARTGNIGLEYSCRGKDSGIVTSEADYYVYKAHIYIWRHYRESFDVHKCLKRAC